MAQLIITKDNEHFVDKLYPELITMIGGKEKMVALLTQQYAALQEKGMSIDSARFLNPNPIISSGKELQTTLTEILVLKIPKGRMVTKSTLIAISKDQGITWYFLDTSGKDLKAMQQGFPGLSDELIIAEREQPVVYEK